MVKRTTFIVVSMCSQLLSHAGADTLVPPFDQRFALSYVGAPPLPNDVAAVAIDPANPDRILLGAQGATPEATVWSMRLMRDSDGHIVGLADEPPQFEFNAGGTTGGAWGSIAIAPNGTRICSTYQGGEIIEVLAGQTNSLILPVEPYGIGAYTTALMLFPASWCHPGRMLVFTGVPDLNVKSANVVESPTGYFLLVDDGDSVQPVPDMIISGAAAWEGCAEAGLGRMIFASANFNSKVLACPPGNPNNGGIPDVAGWQVVVDDIYAPRGMATDPLTHDLIFMARDPQLPTYADRIAVLRFVAPCSGACIADLDGNGNVAGGDLGILLAQWDSDCPDYGLDLDGSGSIDGGDLGVLLAAWGPCAR